MKISVINNNLYTNFRAKEQPPKKTKNNNETI